MLMVARKGNNNSIGACGVLRDSDDIYMDLWVLCQFRHILQIDKLLVESDFAFTVHLMLQGAGNNHFLGPLVLAFRELLSRS
ncbi:hypothetical protein DVH24_000935 [Malus domestica]|uniref:Uncharacterized protein n=1 Tax=Malus domestica TaxID=3750 RepID=A0A498JZD5_MALDO|nr:hypothetical protein DVH24_000935 [Malus domestica]